MPAGDRYVEVPAEAMFAFLQSKGFSRREDRSSEIVYERAHAHDSRFKVLVYTSISKYASRARSLGGDAIRVVAIFEDSTRSYGIAKMPRVFRTGSVEKVLERTIERAREAYAVCNMKLKERRS
jgi:hypothetical protein